MRHAWERETRQMLTQRDQDALEKGARFEERLRDGAVYNVEVESGPGPVGPAQEEEEKSPRE